MSAFLIRDSPC